MLLPLLCLCCISTVCYFYSCVIIQLHIWHRWMLGKGEVEAEQKEEKETREKSQPSAEQRRLGLGGLCGRR